ncbi:bestrophin-like domain [Actinocorallia populi]|uniref:bestrophin-like domain n=1 Tax=Actinocorallia populi TaxID=2079200 RepID=UPI000D096576|nr:DUF4239 domain-containing protein [Actinocorallia populi]
MFSRPKRRSDRSERPDRSPDTEPDGPTSSHAGAMFSALFLLVFAIAIIVPWTVADSARQNTYAEAQALTEAYWNAGDLPADSAMATREALREYTRFVTEREWRLLARGELAEAGWARLNSLRADLGMLEPRSKDEKDSLAAVEAQLEQVYAARRQRAVDAQASLPPGVLWLTVLTAGLVLAFPLLAGARPRGPVRFTYLLLAGSVAVGVYLVFAINHTFTGPLGVDASAFESAWREFRQIP